MNEAATDRAFPAREFSLSVTFQVEDASGYSTETQGLSAAGTSGEDTVGSSGDVWGGCHMP